MAVLGRLLPLPLILEHTSKIPFLEYNYNFNLLWILACFNVRLREVKTVYFFQIFIF